MSDGTRTQQASREQRRAAALRENLKRRKAQARAQSATGPKLAEAELTGPIVPAPEPSDPDESGK
jgi:hypothetical protein